MYMNFKYRRVLEIMSAISIIFVFLPPEKQGVVAQLVERMLRKHEVAGPTPVGSTKTGKIWKKKKHLIIWLSAFFVSTEGRDRTGTSVTSLVFETNASTYSATSAQIGGKNTLFFDTSDNYFLEPSASRRCFCFGVIYVSRMFLFRSHLRLADVVRRDAARRVSTIISRSTPGYPPISQQEPPISVSF